MRLATLWWGSMQGWMIVLGSAAAIVLAFLVLRPRNIAIRMFKGAVTVAIWIAIMPTAAPWLQSFNDRWFSTYPDLHTYIAGSLMATVLAGIYAAVAFSINKLRGVEEEEDPRDSL